jgi:hypothetical protein
VSVQQRSGSSVNLHGHIHAGHLDGVYERDGDRLVFHFVEAPSQRDLQDVVDEVARAAHAAPRFRRYAVTRIIAIACNPVLSSGLGRAAPFDLTAP